MFPFVGTFPEGQMIAFALVFLRMTAFVVAMPAIGSQNVPVVAKVLLSLTLALLVFPTLHFSQADYLKINEEILVFSFREVVVGLFLGFLMRLFFFAIQAAGELVGVSSGLASAQLYNPMMGTQGNVFEQFFLILSTLFFFGMNGHHIFLQGLAQSFDLVPVSSFVLKTQGFLILLKGFQAVLLLGIKMASPVVVSIFVSNLAMGVLGRAVPQMNVFVTSLQVTVLVTLFVLILMVPFFIEEMEFVVKTMAENFYSAMKVI